MMDYYQGFEKVDIEQKRSLAIGVFDGVHLGHQKIINKCLEEASIREIKSSVITFFPHPEEVLNPDKKVFQLTGIETRRFIIEKMGIDEFINIKFTLDFAKIKADDFLKKIIDELNPEIIIVGENFRFGYGQEGDSLFLQSYCLKNGVEVELIPVLKIKGRRISSTWIRDVIFEGNLKLAQELIGRKPFIICKVVKGRGLGRRTGYHTVNLITDDIGSIPKRGVYAGIAEFNGEKEKCVINIGIRPTFGRQETETIEAHIIEWDGDLYDQNIEIHFYERLRDEIKFSDIKYLVKQIEMDIVNAKKIFK